MKPNYFLPFFALLLSLLTSNANAGASGLKVRCDGSDVGAEVSVNGKFKGECPLVIEVAPGKLTLRAFKKDSNYDYVFEQDIRLGDGVVKNIDVVLEKRLNAAGQKAENDRLVAEKEAAARRAAEFQENERRQREFLQAEQANFLSTGPEMIPIPDKNYEMGKFEVTQAEWRAIMGSNPSYLHCEPRTVKCTTDRNPVENVTWRDMQEFLKKLNAMTGKQYRLPTQEEWIYACYGGQGSLFSKPDYCGENNLDAIAWHGGNSSGYTHPVGQKKPNGYGLYDMTGNIYEATGDLWSDDGMTVFKILGGSWRSTRLNELRTVWQDGSEADYRQRAVTSSRRIADDNWGFRLARTLP